jgi:hypothetical protein
MTSLNSGNQYYKIFGQDIMSIKKTSCQDLQYVGFGDEIYLFHGKRFYRNVEELLYYRTENTVG